MANAAKESQAYAICGKTFAPRDLVPGIAVRDAVSDEILRDHPDWSPASFICRSDLNRYRAKYVHSLLESEKGDLTSLEQEVVHSLQEHETLAKNVDTEFEED